MGPNCESVGLQLAEAAEAEEKAKKEIPKQK